MAIYPQYGGRFSYTRTGEFRCRTKAELPVAVIILTLIPLGVIFLLSLPKLLNVENVDEIYEMAVYAADFRSGLCVFIIGAVMTGVTFKYYAGDDEFKITDNRKRTEYFYYSDVESVDYVPITLITKYVRGYQVTITTKYRKVTYDYIGFGLRRVASVKETPFYLLEMRSKAVREGYAETDDITRLREDRERIL